MNPDVKHRLLGKLSRAIANDYDEPSHEKVRDLFSSDPRYVALVNDPQCDEILGSPLNMASNTGSLELVSLLLDRGADINSVSGCHGSALNSAAAVGRAAIVSLLLDRGANHNAVDGGGYGSALSIAIHHSGKRVVSLLLDRGVDPNAVCSKYGSALGAASALGKKAFVSLLLDRGADINAVNGEYGSALSIAIHHDRKRVVSLLLDRGVDPNVLCSKHGSALGTAAYFGNRAVASLLLHAGADINLTGGEFGTALSTAAHRAKWGVVSLLLDRGADINAVCGENGSALSVAAYNGNKEAVKILLNSGAAVNAESGKYVTAFGAAMAGISAYGDKANIMSLLVANGADISPVVGKYGNALGRAAYLGHRKAVLMLLGLEADIMHVGGCYETTQGEYPSALDAAKAGHGKHRNYVLGLLIRACAPLSDDVARRPPFPMPLTTGLHSKSSTHLGQPQAENPSASMNADSRFRGPFPAGGNITPEQANVLCKDLSNEILVSLLVALIGITKKGAYRHQRWMKNDIRYFISQNFDFGLAYAAARIGWKYFNEYSVADVARQRGRWLKQVKELDETRKGAIESRMGKEIIKSPYSVMPRRIWDLKSNRVVEYGMLHAEHRSADLMQSTSYPAFWAVTHSWTADMVPVITPINQCQWPVPLPKDVDLDHNVRAELLQFGAEYVWIDVLCLRQRSTSDLANAPLHLMQEREWKIDVPTIGNIYRSAQRLVRYFNGLGRPFSNHGWDDSRHWLRRAWTLQEIRTESMTVTGAMSPGVRCIILNTPGEVGGKATTLRREIAPVLKLTAELDSPGGCTMYQLMREMAKRFASKPTDKVAGLLYLLRPTELPTYNEHTTAESAWRQCFHVLPFRVLMELLFDFPYRGLQQWSPTWKQMLEWPERYPDYEHSPAKWPQSRQTPMPVPLRMEDNGGIFVTKVRAISRVLLRPTENVNEYEVEQGNYVFGFYSPYLSQEPINVTTNQRFTLVVLSPGHSYNWVVCGNIGKRKEKHTSDDGKDIEVDIHVLRKVGVLRTDSSGEILVAKGDGSKRPMLQTIDCLFV